PRCDPPSFPTRRSSDLSPRALGSSGLYRSRTERPLAGSMTSTARLSTSGPFAKKYRKSDPETAPGAGVQAIPKEPSVGGAEKERDRKSTRLNSSHQIIS